MNDEMRLGRNDPCPCGSGKKYKRCCLAQTEARDLIRNRLRRAEGTVVPRALEYAVKRYGKNIVALAWEDFCLLEEPWPVDEPLPADDPLFENTFLPWFVFNWIPPTAAGVRHPRRRRWSWWTHTATCSMSSTAASPAQCAADRTASTASPLSRRGRAYRSKT